MNLLNHFILLIENISLKGFLVDITSTHINLTFNESVQVLKLTDVNDYITELNNLIELDMDKILIFKDDEYFTIRVQFKNQIKSFQDLADKVDINIKDNEKKVN